jgi:hypothetical protein
VSVIAATHKRTRSGIRVRCTDCGWTGYRHGLECECYEDWAIYCSPWSPGPGCPSGVLYRCPQCVSTAAVA